MALPRATSNVWQAGAGCANDVRGLPPRLDAEQSPPAQELGGMMPARASTDANLGIMPTGCQPIWGMPQLLSVCPACGGAPPQNAIGAGHQRQVGPLPTRAARAAGRATWAMFNDQARLCCLESDLPVDYESLPGSFVDESCAWRCNAGLFPSKPLQQDLRKPGHCRTCEEYLDYHGIPHCFGAKPPAVCEGKRVSERPEACDAQVSAELRMRGGLEPAALSSGLGDQVRQGLLSSLTRYPAVTLEHITIVSVSRGGGAGGATRAAAPAADAGVLPAMGYGTRGLGAND